MNKLKCYEYLSRIDEKGTPVEEHLEKVMGSEQVPVSTIKFINEFFPLDSIKTYEGIYNNRHKNPLYKNLVNENASIEDKAIALSSLLTRAMIYMSNLNEKKRREYASDMRIQEISDALISYSYNKDSTKLEEFCKNLRLDIKELF